MPPTYDYDYGDDYAGAYDSDYEAAPAPQFVPLKTPTMADKTCDVSLVPNVPAIPGFADSGSATCVGINRCPGVVDNPAAPQTHIIPCGFDDSQNTMMVCCPDKMVVQEKAVVQEPRFPAKNGKARKCEDRSKLCGKWKSKDGCRLDVDITISKLDPFNGKVLSANLFDFMQTACPQTCGWCGQKGCTDEHPRCQEWTRAGMCVVAPIFMAHTCRESCGVCGFLSPFNTEVQEVDGLSYTDFTSNNFDCGRYKALCEINKTSCNKTEPLVEATTTTTTIAPSVDVNELDLRSFDDLDVFFSSAPNTGKKGEYFCGATMVADRWVVAASHCYDDFAAGISQEAKKVRVNTIRSGTPYTETLEIKRVYKHPLYKFPNLYNDIAILELGRRVEYNYEKFGDTPTCIDQGLEKVGKIATVQGFGLTETGSKGDLLEANVTVISDEDCVQTLRSNTSANIIARQKIIKALPLGLNVGLMCAAGILNKETNVTSGSCKGDSGGPLTQVNPQGRTTLIGIVSGGIDCGKGYPGWYTRVEHYKEWIQCIIDQSVRFKNEESKVQAACQSKIEKLTRKCEEIVEDIDNQLFDLRSLNLTPEKACEAYNVIDLRDNEDPSKFACDAIFGCDGDAVDGEIFSK